jgi:hypothetical protein
MVHPSVRCSAFRTVRASRAALGALLVVLFAACALACSGEGDDGGGLEGSGGSGATGATATIDPNAARGGGGNANGSGGSGSLDPGECGETALDGCVGHLFEGEAVPLDIYIMFDQSGSMLNDVGGMTRLRAVQDATTAFLRDPASEGIGIGIGYFGYLPIGATSCDDAQYSTPDVEVTLDHEPIVASLAGREPTGETPTAAALNGACEYASAWKTEHPGRSVVILLVTDGKPEAPVSCAGGGCCPTIDEAAAAAQKCLDTKPKVPTYVLGVGPELESLDRIAESGGTRAAYLVGDDDVTANVLAALNAIRGEAAIPCSLEIPPAPSGEALDYGAVNLLYAPSACDYSAIYHVGEPSQCGDEGGWYYDDPSNPHRVELCAVSCDQVSRPGSRLRFSVGCETVGPPVR